MMKGLKQIRIHYKFNQLKVAIDLRMSREAISHYETGKRQPSLQILQTFSKYYGVSIDYLITGKDFIYSEQKIKEINSNKI
ncbi:MAG: helix-turn-helix transcriptional regulator [Clostridia bacterium]